jgi:hypothetical protein
MRIEGIKRRITRMVPLFLSLFCMFPIQEHTAMVNFAPVPAGNLHNAEIRKNAAGAPYYTISDVTYRNWPDPSIIDTVLSFNRSPESLVMDDVGHYRISYADYVFEKNRGELGGGCARFFRKSHRIELQTNPDLWLGQSGDLGSFTVEFRFRPDSFVDGSVIFSRTGFFSGSKRGFEIVMRNRRLIPLFHDMFEFPDGRRKTLSLTGGQRMKSGQWYHFAVSFERMTGRLTKYLNGREEESLYATEDGTDAAAVLAPVFGKRISDGNYQRIEQPVARIGGAVNGMIDEFRISRISMEELRKQAPVADKSYRHVSVSDRMPSNNEGIVTSEVQTFGGTGTKVTFFDWEEELPAHTFIWAEFRICDRLFYRNDNDIKWYRIKKGQRGIYLMRDGENNFLRGRYYQWRMHLVPSPDGARSPRLSGLRLSCEADNAPTVPRLPEVKESGDRYIVLRWKKNEDADLAGYRIYYGVVKGRFDGIIRTINGQPVTNAMAKGNYIEVKIDNDVIEENREKDRSRLLSYPLINNTVLYFLSVSAFDAYRPDTPYNHESAPSVSVQARPYAGTEIR